METKPSPPPVPVIVAAATRYFGRLTLRRAPTAVIVTAMSASARILTGLGMESQTRARRLTPAERTSSAAAPESR